MRFATLALGVLGTAIGVEALSGTRDAAKYDRRVRFAHKHAEQQNIEAKKSQPQYLTKKTRKFRVDGSALPEVHFDIGESYAGLMPIDEGDKQLYFFFVPTTNPAAKNEITIWLNGGPGCSSLDGFFHENGPVVWQPGTYRPTRNTYAWNNLTNVVWVEQPVGTGYTQGTANATDEVDVASQFRGFWKNFVDAFDLHKRDVYVTGESYAGQYVPYIADGMINQTNKEYFNVKGIMVYDPSIGYDKITEQVPTKSFINSHALDFPFNDTFRRHIDSISAKCGYDEFERTGLTFPPKKPLPSPPGHMGKGECNLFGLVLNEVFNLNPCFDIYQVGQVCPIPWDVLGFPYSDFFLPPGFNQPYFNRTDVKKVINAPVDKNWYICSHKPVFVNNEDKSLPSAVGNGPMKRVVEHTNNVIVGHGELDMVLILNGSLLTLNNLTWNGARGFTAPPTKPFYVPYHDDPVMESVAAAGVFGGWQEDRGLTFVTIDLSGHEVPEFQPSAAYRHLEKLLGRIGSLSEVSAFTTQKGYPQSKGPLGKATGPYLKKKQQELEARWVVN